MPSSCSVSGVTPIVAILLATDWAVGVAGLAAA